MHGPSGTAYGTACLRENERRPDGRAFFLLGRADLVLRFELPQPQAALLGRDARRVLEESTLYWFPVEKVGPVRAVMN